MGLGDGWHGTFQSPDELAPALRQLRVARPEETFTLSSRVGWDGLRSDHDEVRRELEAFEGLGLQHLMASPAQGTLDDWLRSVEALAGLFGLM
jgi:hypothetical protein